MLIRRLQNYDFLHFFVFLRIMQTARPTLPSFVSYRRISLPLKRDLAREVAKAIVRFHLSQPLPIVKAVVFLPSPDARLQDRLIRRLQAEAALPGVPALTVVAQRPFEADTVALDIFHAASPDLHVRYASFQGLPYVTVQGYGCRQIWSSGYATPYARMKSDRLSPAYAASLYSLTALQHWIDHIGLSFDHVIRQWNYIGGILNVATMEKDGRTYQNYQEFNSAREVFYREHKQDNLYPAATGIGCDDPGIIVEAVLFETADGHRPIALKSPVQAEAFNYTDRVLVGDRSKTPPLFSRARLQACTADGTACHGPTRDQCAPTCWVSGTASIIGEKTLDPTRPEKQIENTIDAIARLVSTAPLPLSRYERVRLYLKTDLAPRTAASLVTRLYACFPPEICQVVYADVCRNDLWVEIEAETGV